MKNEIRVVELFAGVGGFRIGLEGAADAFKTIWNNQWEPSTKHQDASLVYQARFGKNGHSNEDINTVATQDIPDHDLLVGGFPCQDYSVASTLSHSGGIEGKKGVLWWQIYRILKEKGAKRPHYLFLENVDRIINSPANQRGRDFAIILASLADLGYIVEWRVINAADYGFPQRRKRTYIVAYQKNSIIATKVENAKQWTLFEGVLAKAFPFTSKDGIEREFAIDGDIQTVSDVFNKGKKDSPFEDAGIMINRQVYTTESTPTYNGEIKQTLGDILVDEAFVPEEFFIPEDELPKWQYEKGAKQIKRVSKEGYEYVFSEGSMAFPDYLDKPSRTMITGEGGTAPSRFKHVVKTPSGRYRRLIPLELERLNMFPDNHTLHPEVSDGRRAFLMGNALVCGVVQEVGKSLYRFIYGKAPISHKPIHLQRATQPVLELSLFNNLAAPIACNAPKKTVVLDETKHLLIGLVKEDNTDYFLDESPTKIYYTGKTYNFPSTIALNKLYYFMPYIKGKGIRDCYLIHIARIGNKAEIYPEANDKEPRLVFELEFIKRFPEYINIQPNILYTYRDTTLGFVLSQTK
ncbi:MAG: DNA (cytosine-5-)-methyltransferase [Paludibacteraceae bacterium]